MPTVTWLGEAKLLGATDPESYRKELLAILANLGTLSGEAETAAVRILGEARKEVIDRLAQMGLEAPSRAMYQRALAGVDQATANMAADLGKSIEALQAQAAGLGFDLAVKPIAGERGLEILASAITQDQLRILSQYSADLIQGLQADLRSKINNELASVVVGAKSPHSAAVAIGKNLTDKNHFSTIAHRARAIVVTEVGRAQALGTQAGMQTLASTLKAAGDSSVVRKRWLNGHLPGARQTHLEAEARYAPDGSIGPIPVDQLFEIGGFKALYPKDPSLPPSESVHCHCVTVTVIDEGSFQAVAQGPPAQAAQAAYTTAKVKAAAPAHVATTKGLLGQKAAAFVQDPYTAAGLKADKLLKNGQTGYGGTFMAKALGYADPKDSGFIWDGEMGAWKHKHAPPGKQLPKPYHLTLAEQKALMAAADLDPGEQSQILAQAAKAGKADPPKVYATKKPDVPPAPPPPPAALIPEPPKPAPIATPAAPAASTIASPTYTNALGQLKTKGFVTHEGGQQMRLGGTDGNTVQIFTPATGKWVKYNPATDVWHPEIGSAGAWIRTAKTATSKKGQLEPLWTMTRGTARKLEDTTTWYNHGEMVAKGSSITYNVTSALKDTIARNIGAQLEARFGAAALDRVWNDWPDKYSSIKYPDAGAQLASDLIHTWASTSGDEHPGALAMQRAAASLFDQPWPPRGYKLPGYLVADAERLYNSHKDVLDGFLNIMYERTQEQLARLYPGQKTFRLARGIDVDYSGAPREAQIVLNPMSSFSIDPAIAARFAGGPSGTMIWVEVPVERILSTSLSGFGCFHEFEWVVLGSRKIDRAIVERRGSGY